MQFNKQPCSVNWDTVTHVTVRRERFDYGQQITGRLTIALKWKIIGHLHVDNSSPESLDDGYFEKLWLKLNYMTAIYL